MSEMNSIPSPGKNYTYGQDEFGEFGTVFDSEEEFEVPPPLETAALKKPEPFVTTAITPTTTTQAVRTPRIIKIPRK